jgi:hypothetical protein
MAGSPSGQGPPDPARPHEPTLTSQPGQSAPSGADLTRTVTGGDVGVSPAPAAPQAGPSAWGDGVAGVSGGLEQVIRYGPGVPGPGSGAAAPTAEQVWRTGLPGAARRPRRLLRVAGLALSVALLAASGVVMFLRLHHGPFAVTGAAITAQVKKGCTEDVTGRIGTTGSAGTVSYQWVFDPGLSAPQPLSQAVAAGQSAVYVTAAVEGQGHGTLAQTVTLQVLGPAHDRAVANVVLSC